MFVVGTTAVVTVVVFGAGNFDGITASATVRNIFVYVALCVPLIAARKAEAAWILPILLPAVAAQFGQGTDGDAYPWWAVTVDPQATALQLAVASGLMVGALCMYVLGAGRLSGTIAPARQSDLSL